MIWMMIIWYTEFYFLVMVAKTIILLILKPKIHLFHLKKEVFFTIQIKVD